MFEYTIFLHKRNLTNFRMCTHFQHFFDLSLFLTNSTIYIPEIARLNHTPAHEATGSSVLFQLPADRSAYTSHHCCIRKDTVKMFQAGQQQNLFLRLFLLCQGMKFPLVYQCRKGRIRPHQKPHHPYLPRSYAIQNLCRIFGVRKGPFFSSKACDRA